jgi:hypothetical protein
MISHTLPVAVNSEQQIVTATAQVIGGTGIADENIESPMTQLRRNLAEKRKPFLYDQDCLFTICLMWQFGIMITNSDSDPAWARPGLDPAWRASVT